jgi:hypothetical protein
MVQVLAIGLPILAVVMFLLVIEGFWLIGRNTK